MEKIGKKIKQRLLELNMSQRELVKQTGICEVSISRYINCTRSPRYDAIMKICKALRVSPNYLLGDTEPCIQEIKDRKELQTDMETYDVEVVVTVTQEAHNMTDACANACILVREATKNITENNYGVDWIGVKRSKYSR